MNIKRTWIVASATVALAGFAGAGIAMAADDVELQDPRHAPAVQLPADAEVNPVSGIDSARSADSASDSPGEPGYVPPAPAPAPVDSANSPAPAPAPVKAAADSANSPAPAPAKPPAQSGDSANSPASAQSANSAASADSGD